VIITQEQLEVAQNLIAELDQKLAETESKLEQHELWFARFAVSDYAALCTERQPGGGSRWEATDVELIERFGSSLTYARDMLDWLHRGGVDLIIAAMWEESDEESDLPIR